MKQHAQKNQANQGDKPAHSGGEPTSPHSLQVVRNDQQPIFGKQLGLPVEDALGLRERAARYVEEINRDSAAQN
eukprot:SAG11_NODE_10170_length_850_cov_0.950732_2_plen_74_part_00